MAEHFDVIIVGTGAGGGTLAHALAGSGKRILLLERGDFLPREMDNWDPRPVFVDGKYISKDTWFDGDGQAVPAAGALLRGRGDQAVRRGAVPAAARGFRGTAARGWASPRRGRCPMTTSSPGIRRRSSCTRCTATVVRTRPRATAAALPVARGLPRAQDRRDLRGPGEGRLPAVPRAVRDPAGRGEPARQRVHPVYLVRWVPVPGARQVRRGGHRRPPGPGPQQRHPGDRGRGDQAADRSHRAHRHRGRGVPRRRG